MFKLVRPIIDAEHASSVILKQFMAGLIRKRPSATPVEARLIFVPYWIGAAAVRVNAAFAGRTVERSFACDAWHGVAGFVDGELPNEASEDEHPPNGSVHCRVTREAAVESIARYASRLNQGRLRTASLLADRLELGLVYKPYWAVRLSTADGGDLWRLVGADDASVAHRFDGSIQEMLSSIDPTI